MGIEQRFCVNHPDRAAIGVCVITARAICGECSTRYEGVNYSREGLKILQERRAAAQRPGVFKKVLLGLAALGTAPILFYLVYLAFSISTGWLIDVLFRDS